MAQQQNEFLSPTEKTYICVKIEPIDDTESHDINQVSCEAVSNVSQDDNIAIKPEPYHVKVEYDETHENVLATKYKINTSVKIESDDSDDQLSKVGHGKEESNPSKVPVLSAPGIPNIPPLPSVLELQRAEARRLLAEKQMFPCDECSARFTSNYNLMRHKKQIHVDEIRLSYDSQDNSNGKGPKEWKQLKCNLCDKKLSHIKTLRSHIKTYHGPAFTCEICSKPFYLEADFKSHGHDTEKPYACDLCERRFQHEIWLEKHKVSEHEKPVIYTCEVCGKRFPKNCHLRMHLPVHTGEKKYKCDLCPKSFKQKFSLTYHRETHTGDLRYRCDICDRRFSSKTQMKAHMKGHRDKQFQCDVCDKKFRVKSLLEYHKPRHYGDKPFVCEICSERFAEKADWLSHAAGHNRKKRFQCDMCNKGFSLKVSLIGHIKRVHFEEKPYSCEICGKNYALKQHYDRHSKTHKD